MFAGKMISVYPADGDDYAEWYTDVDPDDGGLRVGLHL